MLTSRGHCHTTVIPRYCTDTDEEKDLIRSTSAARSTRSGSRRGSASGDGGGGSSGGGGGGSAGDAASEQFDIYNEATQDGSAAPPAADGAGGANGRLTPELSEAESDSLEF